MDSVVLTTANAKTSEANKLRLELTSNLRVENQVVLNVDIYQFIILGVILKLNMEIRN